jgi:hypothetical protein
MGHTFQWGACVRKTEVVGVRIGDVFCVCGYCFPNTSRQGFDAYLTELDHVMK